MKVFLTSATGFIGSEIVKLLTEEGHIAVGLARSKESAAKLERMGVQIVLGSLQQPEILASAASEADAVIHTAFVHGGGSYEDACQLDLAAVQAMTASLAGTNKAFILSSGSAFVGDTGPAPVDESYPVDPETPARIRVRSERAAIQAAGNGVRTVALRLPLFVWGNCHGKKGIDAGLIGKQIEAASKLGKAYYILPGDKMTSGVHVEDAARAYVLALKHASAGSIYNITTSNDTSFRSMAEAVGTNVGVPVEGISFQEAVQQAVWPIFDNPVFGPVIFSLQHRVKSDKAQDQLKWHGSRLAMAEDIATGSYTT